ncbi:putative Histidine phosphatase superfamily (branch 1) [Trypanosoma vivax]|uniref:Putative fructose-6-phosphate2-kinase/fructose-2,6-bisphosphatase-like protein n=1 Tax=Trypanosoma vivax (strain Y486) TaxID=1055687 RepID=G0U6A0_TRYVY|nr:putative fructose-6-phosphate2-kinase/fructose-2, 6-bisphosphatase-like protein [Trypanosoma vivax]KAH8611569.1 putative Histidine phosphatase superfamily (branch 1) [Trypanosoma vivax]CCC51403.1 putative fructose-6-phosphate2-kinase/fructose-2,6-bisphosphatase-like protein [Trypanosoma vivax Y486]
MLQPPLPLKSCINAIELLGENGIDFCKFEDSISHSEEYTPQFPHTPHATTSDSTNPSITDLCCSSRAAVVVVSSLPRCSLVARFFCTKLTHYLRWCDEIAEFALAGDSLRDFQVKRHEDDPVLWEQYLERALKELLGRVVPVPKNGHYKIPVLVLLCDCGSTEAYNKLQGMLKERGISLVRHVWFSQTWREDDLQVGGYIDVCLEKPAFRVTRCRGSSVCSRITSFLNSCLPTLHHIYRNEPLTGSLEETLQSCCPFFFTRHGQSEYNLQDRLGGDPNLTDLGRDDALTIGEFFRDQVASNPRLFPMRDREWDETEGFEVWCSQLKRTRNTAAPSAAVLTNGNLKVFKMLNEIHAGVCEDMTNEEVKLLYPCIQLFRHSDKAGFRYPNGESYYDLKRRLEPLLMDLNATRKSVLVVAHQAVLRTMLSYFGGQSVEKAVHKPCPHRTVWCCTYNRLGEPRLTTISLKPRRESQG